LKHDSPTCQKKIIGYVLAVEQWFIEIGFGELFAPFLIIRFS